MAKRVEGKVAIVTGASRGIGRALALGLAREGASVVIAAKSEQERERLPGSIHTVAEEVRGLGAQALPVRVDVRKDEDVEAMVARTVETFGRVDILINNAGALFWQPVADTPMNRFDLVMDVNVRAAFACSRACLPSMIAQKAGHILMFSPPVLLDALPNKVAYLISKFGMTMLAQGLAGEVAEQGISVNALWPVTAIESQATINHQLGGRRSWRKPDILVDAVLEIVTTPASVLTGQALLDEDFLRTRSVTDFTKYRCDPDHEPPRVPLMAYEMPGPAKSGA